MKELPCWLRGLIAGVIICTTLLLTSLAYVYLRYSYLDSESFGYAQGFVLMFGIWFVIIGVIIFTLVGLTLGKIKGEKPGFYWLKGGIIGFIFGFGLQFLIGYYPPLYKFFSTTGMMQFLPFVTWGLIILGIVIGYFRGKSSNHSTS